MHGCNPRLRKLSRMDATLACTNERSPSPPSRTCSSMRDSAAPLAATSRCSVCASSSRRATFWSAEAARASTAAAASGRGLCWGRKGRQPCEPLRQAPINTAASPGRHLECVGRNTLWEATSEPAPCNALNCSPAMRASPAWALSTRSRQRVSAAASPASSCFCWQGAWKPEGPQSVMTRLH